MQVHVFRGSGRVFGFTGACVVVDECFADLDAFGVHVTDAHVCITEQVV